MTILSDHDRAMLRTSLASIGFTRSITYQVFSGGVLGSAIALSAVIESDVVDERFDESGARYRVRTIGVQVNQDLTTIARLGDKVNYDGASFVIKSIDPTGDLPKWRAELVTAMGVQREDRFRAEGR